MSKKLQGILNANKGKPVKINYEKLKNYLNYEDYFYEMILSPLCYQNDIEISFQGEFVILKPKEAEDGKEKV